VANEIEIIKKKHSVVTDGTFIETVITNMAVVVQIFEVMSKKVNIDKICTM
jgi:hypothetical protein